MSHSHSQSFREARREHLKTQFDLLKHITTLDAAGAAVLLAIYREILFEELLLGLTLAGLGISITIALFGMYRVSARLSPRQKDSRIDFPEVFQSMLVFLASLVIFTAALFGVAEELVVFGLLGGALVDLLLFVHSKKLWRR